jgi:glycosyltransferase involved in cell wall biosynthesis
MYNAENTIRLVLESVTNQTYIEPIEIIVVNDGSTDRCVKIVENMIVNNQTNRIITLINKPNGGVSTARNRGIKETVGEYIAFLDSDDTWHPQKLEIVFNILNTTGINVLGHSYVLYDNFSYFFDNFNIKKISFISLMLRNFAVTPSVIVKREIIEYFDETMRYTEDHELWLRLRLKHNVYFVERPLVKLGRLPHSQGGLSSNRWAMRKGEMQMYLNISKFQKKIIPFLPLLILFSFTKYIITYIKIKFKSN